MANEREVKLFLKSTVEQFPDATHHCWAYRIGAGSGEIAQYSDAGEPVYSAGLPILQAIKQKNLTNVMVIVTRYFGGIKLGIGGLVHAYRDITLNGLQLAGKISKYPLREFIFSDIDYQIIGLVLQVIESYAGRIVDISYGEKVKVIACLPDTAGEWMREKMKNISRGEINISLGKIRWYHLKSLKK